MSRRRVVHPVQFSAAVAAATAAFFVRAQPVPVPPEVPQEPGLREVFPQVHVDVVNRRVEVEGVVPIVADDGRGGAVYLELIACTPNTREHEVLVVTEARPSHVHAALLLLGLEPGRPGSWRWEGDQLRADPPTGAPVAVEFVLERDGQEVVEPASSWVLNRATGEHFPPGPWLFAGSRLVPHMGRSVYDADGTGVFIGLTTFGSEVLAWPEMISPEAAVEQPVWVADPSRTPKVDTPVRIRLRPAPPAE